MTDPRFLNDDLTDPEDEHDPDGDRRNDHHVARDNELSGQNAEWARLADGGTITTGAVILAVLAIIGCVLLLTVTGWWGVATLTLAVAVQIVHVVRDRRLLATARDLEQLYQHHRDTDR